MNEDSEARLIVGLGNPGSTYADTRHNLGFLAVEAFAKKRGVTFKLEKRFEGRVARGRLGEKKFHLLLPTTYMNCSGQAVKKMMEYYGIVPKHMLVVSDDVALPFGKMRLRGKGSAGGHKGLLDIQGHLSTTQYPRLRLGIGGGSLSDLDRHVLGIFNAEEKKLLPELIEKVVNALEGWLEMDFSRLMSRVNAKEKNMEKQHDKE